MQNNDFNTKLKSDEHTQHDEVDLGTFKSVKTLKEAYDCLRKTFTQNAMELAKYKKNLVDGNNEGGSNKSVNTVTNDEKTQKNIKNNDEINKNNEKTQEVLEEDKSDKVVSTPDELNAIVDKVSTPTYDRFDNTEWQEKVQQFFLDNQDARQYATEIGRIIMQNETVRNSSEPLDKAWIQVLKSNAKMHISNDELEQYALQNDAIKNKIIEQYLAELQHKKSAPKVISERVGTQVSAGKSPRAYSMAEAKELAKKFLIK